MELCHGKDKGSKCPLCSYNATTIQNILSHMRAYHANEPNFCVTCGLDGCATSSCSFAGLYSHIYRHHSECIDKRGAYVTGPAKTGHVGTNYTPSLYRSYLSSKMEYLHSVTCIIKPIKYLLRAKN